MILKQGHTYEPMPHDGKVIRRIYRGGRCYYIASPYSPEATQALKAAFPQYFAAIYDYGVAHPQLVPFVNEDPMLIVSLVEVGKTRWLDNGGLAYIDTGYIADTTTRWETTYMFLNKAGKTNNIQCGAGRPSNDSRFCFGYSPNGNYVISLGKGITSTISCKYGDTKVFFLDAANKYAMVDNERLETGDTFKSSYANICLGTRKQDSNITDYLHYARIASSKIFKGGVLVQHLLPFTRNGENGMLDILSGTFYPNANTQGAFTIEITDKA